MSDEALHAYVDARKSQLVRNEALHIKTKIKDARGSRHDAGVRWPFELLQNAIDAGPRPGRDRVDVSLRKDGNTFVFEHDGAYFTLQELAALLSGGSSKDFESKETTGRFGTGFLVTHVLAPRTTVAGILSTASSIEGFALVLDRDGDEDSIVANIQECDAAIRAASPLEHANGLPSARFEYVTDDEATLNRGVTSFREAVPYLFATCERLGRVTFEKPGSSPEIWEGAGTLVRQVHDAIVRERPVTCRSDGQTTEYLAVRVATESCPDACAMAILSRDAGAWRVLVPGHEFPRVFCRYPIRSSAFLPINLVLDAPFDLDQERRRILFDNESAKTLFHDAVSASAPLVQLAFDEEWQDRHLLARAAPSPASFADKEDVEEQAWITKELKDLAQQFACLPLVETRNGRGVSVEGTDAEWFADFVDPDADGIAMSQLWALADDATGLYPPIAPLADAWAAIARGWRDLAVNVNIVGLTKLATYVRDEDTDQIEKLKLRCEKRSWIARFLHAVGESWNKKGTDTRLLEGLLPNQQGGLPSLANIKRDAEVPERLKDIAADLGCDVRSRLLDQTILKLATENSLHQVDTVIKAVVPGALSENDVLEECLRGLEKAFPDTDQLSDSNRSLILASISLLEFMVPRADGVTTLVSRASLLAQDGTFARASSQRKMIAPVLTWNEDAREFHGAYSADRLLAADYVRPGLIDALVGWGVAYREPLIRMTPSEPIREDRLKSLAVDGQDTNGVQVSGEEFSAIALLHELIPRCQRREDATALLGLVLSYVASADSAWRQTRVVRGRRDGVDIDVTVRGALWLADLRSRAWVPVKSEEGKTSQVVPTPEALRSLLDPAWLQGNRPAVELLGEFFGFDELDLQLLAAPDDQTRRLLRDQLAHIVELATANPDALIAVQEELEQKQRRAREVARCRAFGLAVQAAIKLALEAHTLSVTVVDVGYDFDVSDGDLEDAASELEVGSYLVEVKATTNGEAKLTPKQAETASQQTDRFVLCVVDLREIPAERLDEPWLAEDVLPLARLVPQAGAHVQGTWALVDQARTKEVGIRNEKALRYAIPLDVWEKGCSISEWVALTFKKAVA